MGRIRDGLELFRKIQDILSKIDMEKLGDLIDKIEEIVGGLFSSGTASISDEAGQVAYVQSALSADDQATLAASGLDPGTIFMLIKLFIDFYRSIKS